MQPIMFAIDSITPKPGTAAAVSSWAMLRRKPSPMAPISRAIACEFFATSRALRHRLAPRSFGLPNGDRSTGLLWSLSGSPAARHTLPGKVPE